MKKIFKEAHKMTKEMVSKYEVDYQAQFGLCLAYLLKNKEEESMIKLYRASNDELFFADVEADTVYEVGYDNELAQQFHHDGKTTLTVDDYFDIEEAVEVKIEDYYEVVYKVTEKNTYAIKEQIEAEDGKWDGSKWIVLAPSKNFETTMFLYGK